jgi:hypothetical protein
VNVSENESAPTSALKQDMNKAAYHVDQASQSLFVNVTADYDVLVSAIT